MSQILLSRNLLDFSYIYADGMIYFIDEWTMTDFLLSN